MSNTDSGYPDWVDSKIEWTASSLIKGNFIHTLEEWESFCSFMEKSAMIWLESNVDVMAEDK
jgi:hypothetical protein